jgi:hypothetical protein
LFIELARPSSCDDARAQLQGLIVVRLAWESQTDTFGASRIASRH